MTDLSKDSPLTDVKGIGDAQSRKLKKLNISTIQDLLFHIPFRYQDTSQVNTIESFLEKGEGTFIAEILSAKVVRRNIVAVRVKDDTKKLTLTYFNQTYVASTLKDGDLYLFDGKVTTKGSKKNVYNPKYEKLKEDISEQTHLGKLIGIYHETKGLSSRTIRNLINKLPQARDTIKDAFTPEFLTKQNLISLPTAISQIHHPKNKEEILEARERLSFDEMLALAIKIEEQNKYFENLNAKPIPINSEISNQFIKSLPYELTNDQGKTVEHILENIDKQTPTNILLNGDVGSGKTVVAALAILNAIKSKHSAILIAPTTVLANQHFKTFTNLFADFNIDIDLCISDKKIINDADNKLIIGTHAILFQKELPTDLNLVIIDEQHKFGVEQREHFRNKKEYSPHYITMTATPIPRSLTEVFFGNLEVLEIKEKPSIRKEIETHYTPNSKRSNCFEWIRERIVDSKNTEQAFIIYPLIEDSENYTAKSVLSQYEKLKENEFKDLKIEYLHGKLKSAEKTKLLEDFKANKFDILISTSVIEVGIDIPNTTMMVIEDAERFGLAQLHQLRGRIGRSDKQSYCYVIPGDNIEKDSEQEKRLKYFADHSSGFDVAEYDLQTRGPGEVFGKLQSGVLQFKVASIHDLETLKRARKVAKELVKEDNSHINILKNLFR